MRVWVCGRLSCFSRLLLVLEGVDDKELACCLGIRLDSFV